MARGSAKSPATKSTQKDAVGKRVSFDRETWHALNLLGRDKMMTLQELAEEAFRDLLKKHGRPTDLRAALRASARDSAANQNAKAPARGRRK